MGKSVSLAVRLHNGLVRKRTAPSLRSTMRPTIIVRVTIGALCQEVWMFNELRSLALCVAAATSVFGQNPPTPPRIVSPEVQGSNVTFRVRAPNAKQVMLSREGAKAVEMQRDEAGVWSVTVGPLEPDFYGYSFIADQVRTIDPVNPLMKPNLVNPTSMMHLPAEGLPWEDADVPHGEVHHHFYSSAVIGDARDYYVYTPPGYDASTKRPYPVLYLLHGFSDDASAWTAVGRANFILDNLIAQRKAKPMIVVMPLGYGVPEIVKSGFPRNDTTRMQNMQKFRDALFNEVIPQVEHRYRAAKERNARAIAGLSMGGAESLYVGLNALDRFAWIGGFSSGGLGDNLAEEFPSLSAATNNKLQLLWIACGTEDPLIAANRDFRQWLTEKGIHHTNVETPGMHTWMVWRRNLTAFASLLFQTAQQ